MAGNTRPLAHSLILGRHPADWLLRYVGMMLDTEPDEDVPYRLDAISREGRRGNAKHPENFIRDVMAATLALLRLKALPVRSLYGLPTAFRSPQAEFRARADVLSRHACQAAPDQSGEKLDGKALCDQKMLDAPGRLSGDDFERAALMERIVVACHGGYQGRETTARIVAANPVSKLSSLRWLREAFMAQRGRCAAAYRVAAHRGRRPIYGLRHAEKTQSP
jgi:hypothetical protein